MEDRLSYWEQDYNLIQASLAGDTSAWENLYQQAYPKVLRQARRKSFNANDIQDIVSDAFLRCYQRRKVFQARSRFSTWVCGFVTYISLEFGRKQRRETLGQEVDWIDRWEHIECEADEYRNPLDVIVKQELNDAVQMAYASLGKRHRTLIEWKVLGERNKFETRQITGIRYKDLDEEAEIAIAVLRRRFLKVYYF